MEAIKMNGGVVIQSYATVALACFWTLVWVLAMIGIYNFAGYTYDENGVFSSNVSGWLLLAMFLSYFYTHQVIQVSVSISLHSFSLNTVSEHDQGINCWNNRFMVVWSREV